MKTQKKTTMPKMTKTSTKTALTKQECVVTPPDGCPMVSLALSVTVKVGDGSFMKAEVSMKDAIEKYGGHEEAFDSVREAVLTELKTALVKLSKRFKNL